jgi:adenosylcobinamide-GDP ribazoletransferase
MGKGMGMAGDSGTIGPRTPKGAAIDLARCLRFYSRLPVPALPWEANPHALPDFRAMAPLVPFAGFIIALGPALALVLALRLGLGPFVSAALAIAALTASTGAFHEDGLADTADGFGGATVERRLAIMKDSLIGSFGGSALALAFLLRIGSLSAVAERLPPAGAAGAILAAAALSRTAGLMPLTLLPPARHDGASAAVGQPTRSGLAAAASLAALVAAALAILNGWPVGALVLMLALPGLVGLGMTRLSARMIHGQTGDVAGAVQQLAEIAAMIGLLIALAP